MPPGSAAPNRATRGEAPTLIETSEVIALFNAGRYRELEDRAHLLIAQYPESGFAWKVLGVSLRTQGKEALPVLQKTTRLLPDDAEAHNNLGAAQKDLGRLDDAVASFGRALAIKPDYAEARSNLGTALQSLGQLEDAVASFRQVLTIKPADAEAHSNLGAALQYLGQFDDAVASYLRALAIKPDYAEAHSNLGNLLQALGQPDNAVRCCRRALTINPDYAEAHCNLGNALQALGQLDEAVASFRRALEIKPDFVTAHSNLGNALQALGQPDEAVASCRRALAIKLDYAEAHSNLSNALQDLGQFDKAVASCRQALAIKPQFAEAHSNLGNALQALGQRECAVASYRRALEVKPDFVIAHTNLLFCLSHSEAIDAQALFTEHGRFGEQFEAPLRATWPRHTNSRDPERCLQIGFVSADLRNHAMASFIEPVLAHLSRYPQLSLHAYSNYAREDAVSQRLRRYVTHWHPVAGLLDHALAQKISSDGIDILIDLSGHTAHHRLLAFARKPAPVQASWIGYPGTTGLRAMDYYLADRSFLPQEQFASQFTEQLVYLPATSPFMPSQEAPPINALPALSNGHMTFGSFNRLNKVSRSVIALWAQLLRASPNSRMLMGGMPEEGQYDPWIEWFAQEGIARDRLSFHPRSGLNSYLGLHHQVDLCLDTFPYSGGTTNFHALWMGVPTLTLAGRTAAGRSGAGILGNVGLAGFVAHSAEEFVHKGLLWAGNLTSLSDIRSGLRERLTTSAVGQPALIAEGLHRALRTMWQRWCEGLPPAVIDVSDTQVNNDALGKPDDAEAYCNQGNALQKLGQLQEAVGSYLRALEIKPDFVIAHCNLGNALQALGKFDEAMASYRRALTINPDLAEAHSNLGNALQALGQTHDAVTSYLRALELKPDFAIAHSNLGNALQSLGLFEQAATSYRQAQSIVPDWAEAHGNLGDVLQALGHLDEAVASYHRALKIKPDYAEAHGNLGNALQALGQLDEAVASYQRVLTIKPDSAEAHSNLGSGLHALGQLDEAVASFRQALTIKPDLAEAHSNLGNALQALGQPDEAVASCRRALAIKPCSAEAHSNLSIALQDLGQFESAVANCRQALAIKPQFAEAHSNLGNALQALGHREGAVASYRQALECKPDFAVAHTNLLFCLSHSEAIDAQALLAEHCRFGEQFEAPLRASWPRHTNSRDSERCLQIGFVSADLRNHAVASFIEPVLAHLSSYPQVSLHVYSNCAREDAVSQRLRRYVTHWNPVAGLLDHALAQKISADGIDILIDLSGHTAHHRLLAFARKPAPVQASWIGYPGTTGLRAMDYYLADRSFLPQEQFASLFTEQLVYLPATSPFMPSQEAPPLNALPALTNGHMTFGSFNRLNKVSRSVIALWAQLLRASPHSIMLMGGMPEDGQHDPWIEWFAQEGIARDRLRFHIRSDMNAYLGQHHQVDLCLDTFPYNGGTTTFHALWMGVPTLTMAGTTAAGRPGAGILGNVGLKAFVAHNAQEFVQQGLFWASNLKALSDIRSGLRERLTSSAVGQPALIAEGLHRALRSMWQRWCEGLSPGLIDVSDTNLLASGPHLLAAGPAAPDRRGPQHQF